MFCWFLMLIFFFLDISFFNEEHPVHPGLHVVNWQCEYAFQIFFYSVSTGILTKFSSLILIWRTIHVYSQVYGFWLMLIWCNWDRIVLSPLLLLLTHSVVSDSLQLHGLQYARLPCPTLSPGVCSNWCDVHWVDDAIQPSHPLLPPSSVAFNLSQHQSLYQWVGSSHQVAKL